MNFTIDWSKLHESSKLINQILKSETIAYCNWFVNHYNDNRKIDGTTDALNNNWGHIASIIVESVPTARIVFIPTFVAANNFSNYKRFPHVRIFGGKHVNEKPDLSNPSGYYGSLVSIRSILFYV